MRRVQIKAFVEEKTQVNWLVDNLLPDIGWTLLVGRKGLGKTTFAMQLCAAVQDGRDFIGRKTLQTDILFIQADSPTLEWQTMLKRIAPQSKGFTVVDVPAKCLSSPVYVDNLKALTIKTKPGFIVFDSLYNLTSVNINTEGVLVAINSMKDIAQDKPWLLIHHPPQTGETRASGHNSIGANCSNEWHLLRNKLLIDKGRLVKDKEIFLSRDDNGLWMPKEETIYSNKDDDIFNKPVI